MSPSIAYDMLPTRRTTITCLTNAYLVLPDGSLTSHPSSIWVDEVTGKITRIQPYVVDPPSPRCGDDEDDNEDASANVRLIDMNGAIVGPGLIDVQINGAFGVDFSEWNGDDEEYRRKVEQVARGLLQTGVTSFVPTIISQTPETYPTLLPLLDPTSSRSLTHHRLRSPPPTPPATPPIAHVLGYHLEGPFLSPNKPGCHPLQNLRDAPEGWTSFVKVFGDDAVRDPDSSEAGGDAAAPPASSSSSSSSPPPPHCVKMITLAPELDGVGSSVSELASRGWVVSLGHSAATTSEALQAVRNGARMITHLYNAMPQLHHREPGIIGLLGMPSRIPPPTSLCEFNISQTVHSAVGTPLLPARYAAGAGAGQARRSRSSSSSPPTEENELVAHAKAVKEALTRKAVVSAAVAAVAEAAAVGTTTKATKAKANSMIDARWSPPTSPTSARSGPPQFGATRGDADDQDDQDDEDDAPAVSRPYWSIITDGIHCHPQAVNFAYKAHPEGCVLVTDAVQLMDPNLPDGTYPWRSSRSILKRGSSITLASSPDTLAGSAVSLDECVRNLSTFASIPLSRAIVCASGNAAGSLGGGVERSKGRLEVGWDADLAVWSRMEGKVVATWVRGREAWAARR